MHQELLVAVVWRKLSISIVLQSDSAHLMLPKMFHEYSNEKYIHILTDQYNEGPAIYSGQYGKKNLPKDICK